MQTWAAFDEIAIWSNYRSDWFNQRAHNGQQVWNEKRKIEENSNNCRNTFIVSETFIPHVFIDTFINWIFSRVKVIYSNTFHPNDIDLSDTFHTIDTHDTIVYIIQCFALIRILSRDVMPFTARRFSTMKNDSAWLLTHRFWRSLLQSSLFLSHLYKIQSYNYYIGDVLGT